MIINLFYFIVIIQPQNQSACVGGIATFTCVVMWPHGSGTIGPAAWFFDNGLNIASGEPGHTTTNDIDGRSAPTNVTNTLIVTNVNISNNGSNYLCANGLNVRSNTAYLIVLGKMCCNYLVSVCIYM